MMKKKRNMARKILRVMTGIGIAVVFVAALVGSARLGTNAALANLRSAIRINPSYVEALLALASLLERRGDFDQSQSYAERASQLAKPTASGLDPTPRIGQRV